jgi:hypothetical protein
MLIVPLPPRPAAAPRPEFQRIAGRIASNRRWRRRRMLLRLAAALTGRPRRAVAAPRKTAVARPAFG